MIKEHFMVMEELPKYASPHSKLTRMIKKGELVKVRRGLYVDPNTILDPSALAPLIYGPSYLSFHYALSAHGLLPERTEAFTSAVFNKNKNKHFSTPFGQYDYFYLPASVYPYGIRRIEGEGYSDLLADPEKALCDTLYKNPGIQNNKDLESFLFENLRIEESDLNDLDRESLCFLAPLYRRKSIRIFSKWMAKL